jgi:hypothetical protein
VSDEKIGEYFEELSQATSTLSYFVFNMDEMGYQAYADRKDVTLWVSGDVEDKLLYFPVSRLGKRITLIACIALDGSFLRPCLIIHRQTYNDDIADFGWTSSKVEVYSQRNSFIDKDIFLDWFQDTFLRELKLRRKRWNYHGLAYLIMDGCSAHQGPSFDALCGLNGVIALRLPAHSSNRLQPLDLGLFAALKARIRNVNVVGKRENALTRDMDAIMRTFYDAAKPPTIVSSFHRAGIDTYRRVGYFDSWSRQPQAQLFCQISWPDLAFLVENPDPEPEPVIVQAPVQEPRD